MKFRSLLFTILGFVSLGFGAIGVVITVIPFLIFPTTPFVILAAFCFSMGNQKFHNRLLNNRIFGPYIVNYKTKQGISLMHKVSGIIVVWTGLFISMFFARSLWIYIVLALIGVGVTIHLLLIKTKSVPKSANEGIQ
jgi:uncharacterized membrane protein YbaN (DUF454 family)